MGRGCWEVLLSKVLAPELRRFSMVGMGNFMIALHSTSMLDIKHSRDIISLSVVSVAPTLVVLDSTSILAIYQLPG
jgi:hypothetical protein